MSTLIAVTEARLDLGRRLAILRPDAGALNLIQFRPAASLSELPPVGAA